MSHPPPLMKLGLWGRANGKFAVMQCIAFLEWSSFISFTFWALVSLPSNLHPISSTSLCSSRSLTTSPFISAAVLPGFRTSVCNPHGCSTAANDRHRNLMQRLRCTVRRTHRCRLLSWSVNVSPLILVRKRIRCLTLLIQPFSVFGTALTSVAGLLFAVINPAATYWAFGFPAAIVAVFGADFVFASGTLFVAKVSLPHEQSLAGGLFQTLTQVRPNLVPRSFHHSKF